MTSINGDPFGEVAMRRSIIGQVELRRSAAAEAAVSAAVRHRGVGRAAAERAPLPRHGRMGRGGWEEFDRAAWAVSSPPPHAQLTLQPLRAGLRESRNGCVRILRCNRCGPVSGGPATAARGVGESGGP